MAAFFPGGSAKNRAHKESTEDTRIIAVFLELLLLPLYRGNHLSKAIVELQMSISTGACLYCGVSLGTFNVKSCPSCNAPISDNTAHEPPDSFLETEPPDNPGKNKEMEAGSFAVARIVGPPEILNAENPNHLNKVDPPQYVKVSYDNNNPPSSPMNSVIQLNMFKVMRLSETYRNDFLPQKKKAGASFDAEMVNFDALYPRRIGFIIALVLLLTCDILFIRYQRQQYRPFPEYAILGGVVLAITLIIQVVISALRKLARIRLKKKLVAQWRSWNKKDQRMKAEISDMERQLSRLSLDRTGDGIRKIHYESNHGAGYTRTGKENREWT